MVTLSGKTLFRYGTDVADTSEMFPEVLLTSSEPEKSQVAFELSCFWFRCSAFPGTTIGMAYDKSLCKYMETDR